MRIYAKTTEKNTLEIFNKELVSNWIKTLPIGTEIELNAKLITDRRREEANNYYWMVVQVIADYLGYTKEELHVELKTMFNSGKSTAKLDKKEFNEYINKVSVWASTEHGLTLPGN